LGQTLDQHDTDLFSFALELSLADRRSRAIFIYMKLWTGTLGIGKRFSRK
jgi:hypothetical protein